jgi:glycerol-3-phosphate dehydrogenase
MSVETVFDIFVIGGGINGCGIARVMRSVAATPWHSPK